MASTTVLAQVQGTLSTLVNEQYATYNVTFDLEIKQLRGSRGGIDDEAIARVSLARGHSTPEEARTPRGIPIAAGKYESTRLRVEGGELLAG